jgi:two-component system, NarL family, response regulator
MDKTPTPPDDMPIPNAKTEAGPIRLMIVDDHQVVRMGLCALMGFHSDILVVAEAQNALQAVLQYRLHRPQAVLMDLRIPGDGATATRNILAEDPDARIIVLTTYDLQEDIHRCLEAGACGYLLKSEEGETIVMAIRAAVAGERVLSSRVEVQMEQRKGLPALTARELEVLQWVAKGYSNREIAERIGFTEHTAKAHLKQILLKLDADDRTEAAMLAVKRGLVRL